MVAARALILSAVKGAFLLFLIVTASYVSIGRILVGQIDKFEVEIEQLLGGALATTATIGGVAGDFRYLDPVIDVSRLVIGSPETPAITIGQLFVRIDVIASLRERSVVIRDLVASEVALTVTQNPDGSWQVEGLPRRESPFDIDPILASLPWLQRVEVTGLDVAVVSQERRFRITTPPGMEMALAIDGNTRVMSLPLQVSQDGSDALIQLSGSYLGDPRDLDDLNARLYVDLPGLEFADFVPATSVVKVTSLSVSGDFWLSHEAGQTRLQGSPYIEQLHILKDNKPVSVLTDFSLDLVARSTHPTHLRLSIADAEGFIGNSFSEIGDVDIAMDEIDGQLNLGAMVAALDVAAAIDPMLDMVDQLGLLDHEQQAGIRALNVKGEMRDVTIIARDLRRQAVTTVVASVHELSVDAHNGIPGVTSLSGFLRAGPGQGYLDIHSEAMSLDISPMFPAPWYLDVIHGRVHYQLDESGLNVASDLLAVSYGALRAGGRFNVNIPDDPSLLSWGLEVGIENADLGDASKYLPSTIPATLVDWLTASVVSGNAETTALLFHGPLGASAPKGVKLYDLFFRVSDTRLEYNPDWPPVEKLSASVHVGNQGVFSNDATGQVFDSRISSGEVSVPLSAGSPADMVLISGDIEGPFSDVVRVLTQTPVSEITNNVAAQWVAEGEVTGALTLDIPIGPRQGAPVGVSVSIELEDDSLEMTELDLRIDDMRGIASYDNAGGLAAQGVTARIFDHDATIRIESEPGEDGGAIMVFVDGAIEVDDLREWSGQSLLTRMTGASEYRAEVHVPYGNRALEFVAIEVDSDLVGVGIDMPPPLRKPTEESRRLFYRQTLADSGTRIDLELGDNFSGSVRSVDGIVRGGRLHFGKEPLGAVVYQNLTVSGQLAEVHYHEWAEMIASLEQTSNVSITSEVASSLDKIDVMVGRLHGFGLDMADVRTLIRRDQVAWDAELTSESVSGQIKVFDDDDLPLAISLSHLHLPGGEEAEGVDPLGYLLPSELTEISLAVASFKIGEEDYGSWSFNFLPQKDGAIFENLMASVRGILVTEARLVWNFGEEQRSRSQLSGSILVGDLGAALVRWGYASSVVGKDFRLSGDLAWPGSPAMLGLDGLTGTVRILGGSGRFVQADSGTGALNLLGIFDFASLARRFRFDFSDVVDEGFSFTEIKGATTLNSGVVSIVEPIVVVGAGSTFKVGGNADLNSREIDSDVIVTLPVSRNLPWYAAYSVFATGPLAGAGVWIAQKIFENQINQMSSAKYRVTGTIDVPGIEFVSIFNDSVRELPQAPAAETGNEGGS